MFITLIFQNLIYIVYKLHINISNISHWCHFWSTYDDWYHCWYFLCRIGSISPSGPHIYIYIYMCITGNFIFITIQTGNSSSAYDVYCNRSDTCTIKCLSKDVCVCTSHNYNNYCIVVSVIRSCVSIQLFPVLLLYCMI